MEDLVIAANVALVMTFMLMVNAVWVSENFSQFFFLNFYKAHSLWHK